MILTVKAIAPTFGGINLEDIVAPECFAIEEMLRATLDISVFHDDQHGSVIISGAALHNALRYVVGKRLDEVRVCISSRRGGRGDLAPDRSASFCSSATSQFGRWMILPIGIDILIPPINGAFGNLDGVEAARLAADAGRDSLSLLDARGAQRQPGAVPRGRKRSHPKRGHISCRTSSC